MLEFKEIEKKVLKFWEDKGIYEKVKKKNEKGEKFYFLQGPPYTSAKIHIGQAWNNSLKDIALRYKRMKGFDVWDRAGYDMHGLPTENAVQKKLGLKTKEDILKYGMEKFVKACLDYSVEHAKYMDKDLWRLGVWMDYKNAYYPIKKDYIDGEWAFFKKAWQDKRLYKGEKVMHWDAETETSLAKHELEYKNIKDESIFLKFKKKNKDSKNGREYFVIWTTTPWTIPFNMAIMANPELYYVDVKVDEEIWTVAKDLAGIFLSGLLGKSVEIVKEYKGDELKGQEYFHPFYDELKDVYDELKKKCPNVHTVILSKDYVDTSAGSGLVHCAPGCGPEDFEVGREYGIKPFNTLNERGEFENLGKFTGWKAKVEDNRFIKELEKGGALIAKTEVEHEYPHSWRSHKPVIFRTTEQWFVKITDLIPRLIEFNKKVKWVPKKSGESYERWTENLRDINITRQRFWGCPIPIWVNVDDKKDYFVVGSVDELEKLSGRKNIEPHKPWVDKVVIEKNGKKYKRVEDVADVWIDSGTASWNCLYDDPELMKKWFPADLILEATEQTRLWFSMLQIYSGIYLGRSSYKNVFTHGMIFDFQGTKMSKSIGNIISPYEVIDKYSADILRYYMCQITAGENINFSWEDIKVKQRNLIILENLASFILDLEKQGANESERGEAGVEDEWILSKYNSTLRKVGKLFEEYRLDETIKEIEDLFMILSRDYIKYVRDRASESPVVLETVKEVYTGIIKIFSTICPFVTDYLWEKIGCRREAESVHLCEWPEYDEKKINENLEAEFELLRQIIEKGLAVRDKLGIGLKWPLQSADVTVENRTFDKNLTEIIRRQLNVKDVKIIKKDGVNISVEFDTKITPELEAEGFAREISRKIQSERKKRGLEKNDRIELKLSVGSELKEVLEKHLEFIKQRTGSETLDIVDKKSSKMIMFGVKGKEIGIEF